jgi:branched-chain amino acid transport system ATP-binding protein
MLEVRDLVVWYGPVPALHGVSLSVEEGGSVALLGANGAGKTTTLRTISGLIRPRSGTILWQGKNLVGLPPEAIARKGIGHVPEGRGLFPELTVWENLKMGAYLRRDFRADLPWIFEIFPVLKERLRQMARTLSGGEAQMLAIARALVGQPKLLLLDEPSLGLDPIHTARVFLALKEIKEAGVSLLLAEQNAYKALEVCTHAYVLELGFVQISGPAQELRSAEAVRRVYLGG